MPVPPDYMVYGPTDEDLDDPHAPCLACSDEHPLNVLEDGFCPGCVDECLDTVEDDDE